MLIFYYGLLFLGTLSISDGVATFLVLCLVDFLLLKAIWDSYKPLKPWKEWLKIFIAGRWEWFKSLSAFKQAYLIIACIIGIPLSILFVALCFHVLFLDWSKIGSLDSRVRNLAIAFIGTISGFGALFGVYLAIRRTEENKRQNDTAEQELITDRTNKATEGLGKINQKDEAVVEVRLGALYALERTAQDSLRDHKEIMEILCAYVRHNSPVVLTKNNRENPDDEIKIGDLTEEYTRIHLREDIQATLTIIGRRHTWAEMNKRNKLENDKEYRIDLKYCNLNGAKLERANLCNGLFLNSNFRNANLMGVFLNDAWLSYANLDRTMLRDANMQNTNMDKSYAYKGDFSQCINLTQEQLDVMYCGSAVKIPVGLKRPEHWSKDDTTRDEFDKNFREWRVKEWEKEFNTPYPEEYKTE